MKKSIIRVLLMGLIILTFMVCTVSAYDSFLLINAMDRPANPCGEILPLGTFSIPWNGVGNVELTRTAAGDMLDIDDDLIVTTSSGTLEFLHTDHWFQGIPDITSIMKKGDNSVSLTVRDYAPFCVNIGYDDIWVYYTASQNQPPVAAFTYLPTNPTIIDTIKFTPTMSDPTNKYTYLWQSSDGATVTTREFSHQFSKIGYYNVNLTVTDPADPVTLTDRKEQNLMVVCGGTHSMNMQVGLGTQTVAIDKNTVCRRAPYTSESGEILQICNSKSSSTEDAMTMWYSGPISGDSKKVGSCDFYGGSNYKTLTYVDNDNNGKADCFLSSEWITKDYAGDDAANPLSGYYISPAGDKLLDWHVTTLDLQTYELRKFGRQYEYNCGCSGPFCIAYDTASYNVMCLGKDKKNPACSKAYICNPPEGSQVGDDELIFLNILAV
jgi:PKD repeat protein